LPNSYNGATISLEESMTDAPSAAVPTAGQLRTELEQTRAAFHELAQSLTPADLKTKSGNPAWTVGQLMWHLAWGMQYMTAGAEALRGKRQFTPPRGLLDLINPWITRLGARGATPESVVKRYDEFHAKVIAALDALSPEDLATRVKAYYDEFTVAESFQVPARHFAEHRADILKGLGRG
jgi:hypothetical protein